MLGWLLFLLRKLTGEARRQLSHFLRVGRSRAPSVGVICTSCGKRCCDGLAFWCCSLLSTIEPIDSSNMYIYPIQSDVMGSCTTRHAVLHCLIAILTRTCDLTTQGLTDEHQRHESDAVETIDTGASIPQDADDTSGLEQEVMALQQEVQQLQAELGQVQRRARNWYHISVLQHSMLKGRPISPSMGSPSMIHMPTAGGSSSPGIGLSSPVEAMAFSSTCAIGLAAYSATHCSPSTEMPSDAAAASP